MIYTGTIYIESIADGYIPGQNRADSMHNDIHVCFVYTSLINHNAVVASLKISLTLIITVSQDYVIGSIEVVVTTIIDDS